MEDGWLDGVWCGGMRLCVCVLRRREDMVVVNCGVGGGGYFERVSTIIRYRCRYVDSVVYCCWIGPEDDGKASLGIM